MAKKQNTWLWIAIVVIAILLLSSGFKLGDIDFSKFNPFSSEGSGLVDVNKQVKYTLIDYYAGSALASKSNTITVLDSDGETTLETNLDTDTSGQGNTAFSYNSGKIIYFKYESSNDKIWWKVTVPQMNTQDAEAATYNLIELRAFTIGTYSTDAFKMQNGTAVADAGSYDASQSGTTMTFTYSLANTGSDNTGLMSSSDPLYKLDYKMVVYVLFSGTGYERILPYGFDYDFTLGTTHYVAKILDPYALTKHKVGNEYRSTGNVETSFTLDMTAVTSGDSVTVQIYFQGYSDPNYAMSHGGNYGPEYVNLAETTMTVTP